MWPAFSSTRNRPVSCQSSGQRDFFNEAASSSTRNLVDSVNDENGGTALQCGGVFVDAESPASTAAACRRRNLQCGRVYADAESARRVAWGERANVASMRSRLYRRGITRGDREASRILRTS